MKPLWSLFLLLAMNLVSPFPAFSAFEDLEVGARPLGMGSAFVAIADDVNGVYWNPGGVGWAPRSQFTAFYSQPYNLKELSLGAVGSVHRLPRGCLGLGYQTFGNRLYQENTYLVAYGHSLGKRISLGASLKFMQLRIDGYGSDTTLGLDLGLRAKLTPKIDWGICAKNLNVPKMGMVGEKLPQSLSVGFGFRPVKGLIIGWDVYKDIRFPSQIRVGQEYKVLPGLTLRLGVGTNPSRFAAGFGLKLKVVSLDYALFTHQVLGNTHQTSLTLDLGKGR